jgi:cell fate (sporulation/competence/biofilm development) regulator YlbF (YheA/YmcA/DUF963 family)
MDEIIEQARRLGQAIRAHERYALLRGAEQKAMADAEALKIQEDLERQLQKMHDFEAEMKPIEVADKRELARLQQLARSNPSLQQLLKVQADYFEMMNRVNQTILRELQPESPPKAP